MCFVRVVGQGDLLCWSCGGLVGPNCLKGYGLEVYGMNARLFGFVHLSVYALMELV